MPKSFLSKRADTTRTMSQQPKTVSRRDFLKITSIGLAGLAAALVATTGEPSKSKPKGKTALKGPAILPPNAGK